MTNKEKIISDLKRVNNILSYTLPLLIDENEDGKQFDFVNSSRLSDAFDTLQSRVERMGKIIYQED